VYHKAVDNGELDALYELGLLHYEAPHPHIVPKDTAKGHSLLTSAADQGHLNAQLQLGLIYERTSRYTLAEKWYTMASNQNNCEGKFRLGNFYHQNPSYRPHNLIEKQLDLRILNLISAAAKHGSLEAKARLSAIFRDGFRSITQNNVKAVQFAIDCINSDPDVKDDPSESSTQIAFHLGAGVLAAMAFDSAPMELTTVLGFKTGLEWFTFGSKHGNALCQLGLAQLYYRGLGGVEEDFALASFWVDKSFRQGNVKAAALLGKMQHRGVFVRPPESDIEDDE
jgi:TPR repeat protein